MSYTPVELRHVRVGRRPLGYHRAGVDQVLSDVADSFETVWRDRLDLVDKVETLEHQLVEARQREQLLTNTLLAAEHAAEEMRSRAKREAELIVTEAHAEARQVLHASQSERERLLGEVRRIESLLRSALDVVGEATVASDATVAMPPPAPAQPAQEGSRLAEPRDFRPVVAPPSAPAVQHDPDASTPQEGPVAEERPAAETDTPGWPPLRRVAQGGANFDWGD